MTNQTYTKLASCEVDAGPENETETETSNHPPPSCNNSCWFFCCWQIPLVLILIVALVASFAAGFGVATIWFPTYRYLDGSISCDAVSYEFLESPEGQELQTQLNNIWSNKGPVASLQYMAQLMKEDSQIASSCHPFLHQLGRMAWREHPKEEDGSSTKFLETVFSEFLGTENENLMRTCNAAYMHGLIEDDLKNIQSKEESTITDKTSWIQNNLCGKFQPLEGEEGDGLSNEWECQHGVGHGILQHRRVLLQQTALEQALKICEQASIDTEPCQNGIWMDYWAYQGMTIDMDFEDGEEDPMTICTELDAIHSCRIYAPTAYLLRHPHDYLGAMKIFCRGGNEYCVVGVGMQTAKENMLNFLPLEEVCMAAPYPFRQKCFEKGVNYYKTSSKSSTIPSYLCDNLSAFKRQCRKST